MLESTFQNKHKKYVKRQKRWSNLNILQQVKEKYVLSFESVLGEAGNVLDHAEHVQIVLVSVSNKTILLFLQNKIYIEVKDS